jgi:hypothetical protein
MNTPTILQGLPELQQLLNPEELHPELQFWLSPEGDSLRHPLVYFPLYAPAFAGLANQQYQFKHEGLKAALAQGEWARYIFLHERPHRFNALRDIWEEIPRARKKAELFIEVWTDSENLWQVRDVWEQMIYDLDVDDFHNAMDEESKEALEAMRFPLQVYRGGDPAYEQGLSYTLDRQRAEWFASRFGQDGELFLTTVEDADQILFYYDGRGEAEVVLHPDFCEE